MIIDLFDKFVSGLVFVSDYEQLFLLVLIAIIFCCGLKKKTNITESKGPTLDLNYSSVLKGIGCLFVAMGHYEANVHINSTSPSLEEYWFGSTIWHTTANVGLVWFMFISGYGLTASRNRIANHWNTMKRRVLKVYAPLLFVAIIAFPLYLYNGAVANDLDYFLHFFGLDDWYVTCIIIFYCLFYISDYFSSKLSTTKKNHSNSETLILFTFLVTYYIIAYYIAGRGHAHYYRLTWAFLFGHLLVVYKDIPKWLLVICLLFGLSTFYFESRYMIMSFVLAIVIIIICVFLNRYFEQKSKILLSLGLISYFFYLAHERICWSIMTIISRKDLLIWILFTVFVSYMLRRAYSFFQQKLFLND